MITNYLPDLIHCLRPDTDEREYDAFILDEDTSEHSPLNLDENMFIMHDDE